MHQENPSAGASRRMQLSHRNAFACYSTSIELHFSGLQPKKGESDRRKNNGFKTWHSEKVHCLLLQPLPRISCSIYKCVGTTTTTTAPFRKKSPSARNASILDGGYVSKIKDGKRMGNIMECWVGVGEGWGICGDMSKKYISFSFLLAALNEKELNPT